MTATAEDNHLGFLAGDGEMAQRMRELDWAATPAGPISSWPQSLKTAVSICLGSRFPIEIWWGPDYLRFYNDAYRPILGTTKHPQFLGFPGRDCWAEVWDVVEPMLIGVRRTGKGIYAEDFFLMLERNGFPEETYFTFSYGPLRDECGDVGGVFCACAETTKAVLTKRRTRTLHDLMLNASTVAEAVKSCAEAMSRNRRDLPFLCLYLLDPKTDKPLHVGAGGLHNCPSEVEVFGTNAFWPITAALETGTMQVVHPLPPELRSVITDECPHPADTAVVLPLSSANPARPSGVLIIGVSPRLPLDAEYRGFLQLLATHVGNAISRASVHEDLQEQSTRLADAFMRSPAFMCILRGPTFVFEYCNEQYYRVVGKRDILGKGVLEALPEVAGQGFMELLNSVYTTGETYVGKELKLDLQREPDRPLESRYVDFVYQVIRDSGDAITGIFVHGVDVTDHMLAQRTRQRLLEVEQEARQAAESASEAKDQFIAVLSHELRTPLTPVLTTVQMMELDTSYSPSQHDSIQMIRRNVELEVRLIDDLLDLTRVSRGKIELRFSTLDVHEKIRQTAALCESDMRSKQLELTLDLAAAHHLVQADPARLQQIFWNLLKNAIKFTPVGGRITIHTGNPCGENHAHPVIVVEVADTGIGIDQVALPRIFDAFEQGGRDVTRQFGGLGLGLAISRALAELHGGSITATSAGHMQGATFAFVLPVSVNAVEEKTPVPPTGPLPESPRSHHILLVEDNADTSRVMIKLLGLLGYTVRHADSLGIALKIARAECFDLLISDIGLPDGTGYDLLQQLGATKPARAIALSGFGMEEDIRKSRAAGFDYHLTKPVNIRVLSDTLSNLLLK